MQNKKNPTALAGANGAHKKSSNFVIAKNDNMGKCKLSVCTVTNLRMQAITRKFNLSKEQIAWLTDNAYGGPVNDR